MGANPIIDEQEIKSSIPVGRLFKAFVLEVDSLLPRILPGVFKSFEILEGDGGVGCVKLVTFAPETKIKAAKHKTEEIDKTKYKYRYSLIEGGILGDDFESISYDIKIDQSSDGGSILTFITTYRPKRDNHHIIQEKINQSQERTQGFVRVIEAHLMTTTEVQI